MKILFVSTPISSPPKAGHEIRSNVIFQALRDIAEVDVVAMKYQNECLGSDVFSGANKVFEIEQEEFQWSSKDSTAYGNSLGRLLLLISASLPFQYRNQISEDRKKWFADLIGSNGYDVIWITRLRTAIALEWYDTSRTIVDGDDFDSVREWHSLTTTPWYGAKVLNYIDCLKLHCWEFSATKKYSRIVRCSESDRRRSGADNVVVIPNSIESPKTCGVKLPATPPRILFVGSLGYGPNAQGIGWFLEFIWPLIRRKVSDAQLDIVGGGVPCWLNDRSNKVGVLVHGYKENLLPFYSNCRLSIAPLLSGAGTRIKILEALAHRTPVVSTRLGCYGLDLDSSEFLRIADSPRLFASKCIELLEAPDLANKLGELGRMRFLEKYDVRFVEEKIRELVYDVAR